MSNSSHNKTAVIIVAAGRGRRAGGSESSPPKQFQKIGGASILARTLTTFAGNTEIDQIITTIHQEDFGYWKAVFTELEQSLSKVEFQKILEPVFGGTTRQESVFHGLNSIAGVAPEKVLIHDAVRPFIADETVSKLIEEISTDVPAVLVAVPVIDTLKQSDDSQIVTGTIHRDGVWQAQTPQGFMFETIYGVHQEAKKNNRKDFTDDTAICEWAGIPVKIIEGNRNNIKLTSKTDMQQAKFQSQLENYARLADVRTGTGFDVHQFGEGNSVLLGGIEIPHSKRLIGHSDADVVLHAITDAIFGALAEGDIGTHFPPEDQTWKAANSKIFLTKACDLVSHRKGVIAHIDLTIICETPKIRPHRNKIVENIAKICDIAENRVAVKATTTEKLGFIGRSEGIACMAKCNNSFANKLRKINVYKF